MWHSALTHRQTGSPRRYGNEHQQKDKVEVEVVLVDGSTMRGYLFVSLARRVADLLNDGNSFLAFEDVSNAFRLLNKASIMHFKPAYQRSRRRAMNSAGDEWGDTGMMPAPPPSFEG